MADWPLPPILSPQGVGGDGLFCSACRAFRHSALLRPSGARSLRSTALPDLFTARAGHELGHSENSAAALALAGRDWLRAGAYRLESPLDRLSRFVTAPSVPLLQGASRPRASAPSYPDRSLNRAAASRSWPGCAGPRHVRRPPAHVQYPPGDRYFRLPSVSEPSPFRPCRYLSVQSRLGVWLRPPRSGLARRIP
jgi:hypothetical protein